ncbi:MAG: hypothetical protein KC457_16330, partial [Myxococcales bacterium]|nr:hypothetical protein [Myxococcales bacterium]
MLASSFFDPVLGIDVHFEMVPTPAPVPTPLPNPFIGIVFDPVGLACGIALGAAIGAVVGAPFQGPVLYWTAFPATNTGTEAKHVPGHILIPPGVAWAPFPKTPKPVIHPGETPTPALPVKPENDAVVVFGSKTVSVMGSNAVRLGDIALSCSEPLRLPSSLVLAIPKGAPILIGGPPSLDLMAAVMASLRTRFVSDSLHALVSRLKPSRFRNFLHKAVCFFTGHPVDVASGKVVTSFTDAVLPGGLPLNIERHYSSAFAGRPGPLGHGWSLSLDQAVWRERGKVVLLAEDGREIEFDTFDLPNHQIAPGQKAYNPIERLTLHCQYGDCWSIVDHRGQHRDYAPAPGRRDGRAMIRRQRSRCGHHEVLWSYDRRGHLEWVRDSAGRSIALTHDEHGRITELHLPRPDGEGHQRHRRYVYDNDGDLVEIEDALGHRWSFTYATHLLTREQDRTGYSFHFSYDGLGEDAWCTRTWGDGGFYDHVLAYDKQKHVTYVTNSRGHTTVYRMNLAGQVVEVVDPLGHASKYEYDPVNMRPRRVTDAIGRCWTTSYDQDGEVIERRGPDETGLALVHNQGSLHHAEFSDGRSWRWDHDGHGRPIAQTDPLGQVTRWGYERGFPVVQIDPRGARTRLSHDRHGNLAAREHPDGRVDRWVHDALGRPLVVTDGDGGEQRRHYDLEGRLIGLDEADGNRIRVELDPEGRVRKLRDRTREAEFSYT